MSHNKSTPKRGTDATVTLTRKRTLIVNKLNKIDNFVTLFTIKDYSFVELEYRQENLQKLHNEHEEIVDSLTEILSVSEFVELQEEIDSFEDKFSIVFRKLTDAISLHKENSKSSIPKQTEHQSEAVKLGIKLPEFHITKFDGDKLKWLAFKNVYIAVIHTRTDINDVVKFTFLLDSIRGKALETIGAINLTSEGYQAAWDNLMRVYDKPKSIAQANIIGLFNLPKCKQGTPEELRALLNMVTSHIASLNALDIKTDKMSDLIIINFIINCLNNHLETEWNKTLSIDEMPQLQKLILFIEKECSSLETLINYPTSSSHPVQVNKHKQQVHRGPPVITLLATADGKKYTNRYPCNICKQVGHSSYQCYTLLQLPVKERLKRISHLCSNCLSPAHTTTQCKSMHGCKVCGLKHNTVLHQYTTPYPTTSAHSTTESIPRQVLLSTAVVLLQSKNGEYVQCRALLDSGSQSNFISSTLSKKLGIQSQRVNIPVAGINNTISTINKKIVTKIKSRTSNYNKSLEFLVSHAITNNLPTQFVDISSWNIPKQYQLADPSFNTPAPIDILIGAELVLQILQSQEIIIQDHLPRLYQSKFGWIITGKVNVHSQLIHNFANFSSSEDQIINNNVQKCCKLEANSTQNSRVTPLLTKSIPCLEFNAILSSSQQIADQAIIHNTTFSNLNEATVPVIMTSVAQEQFIHRNIYSNFQQLIRITAFVLRFIEKCQQNSKLKRPKSLVCKSLSCTTSKLKRPQSLVCRELLTTDELRAEKLNSVQMVQAAAFKDEIQALQQNSELSNNSIIKSLHSFVEINDIIHVGGQIKNASINHDTKYQILLPYNHHVTRTLFQHTHKNETHAGPQLLPSTIRNYCWSTKGKHKSIKSYRIYVLCYKFKSKLSHQLMLNLHASRITPAHLFNTTGVDLSSPSNINQKHHRKDTTVTAYIAIFVCFSTKETHVEIILHLSAEAFIQALKRFIARRRHITTIWSNNATKFHGAYNIMMNRQQASFTEQDQHKITNFCVKQHLDWNVIPARSPHFSGILESFKSHFKKVVSSDPLTYEEMLKLINHIEAILYSKPLTPLSSSSNDPVPITPAHVMIGGPIVCLEKPSLLNIPTCK